jgi:uncharacterized membrane protein YphA (DoxX/SURF4 family)
MLVRRIARPLLATWFAAEGWQVLRHPAPHAARASTTWDALAERFGLPHAPDDARMRQVARAHGGAMALAAALLALGKAPRTASLVLAGLTAPLVLAALPTSPRELTRMPDDDRDRLARATSMLGAALLAGIDNEGRPSMTWRVARARAERAAAHAATS